MPGPAPPDPSPAVATVLWRRRGGELEVFLVRRAPALAFLGGYWSFPGGRVDPGDGGPERPAWLDAAARELAEETGVVVPRRADRFTEAGRFVTPDISRVRFDATYYLVEHRPDEGEPDAARSGGELDAGEWVAPAEALARWAAAAWMIPTVVVRVLGALAAGIEGAAERCRDQAAAEAAAPRLWDVVPNLAMCPVRTPTLPPATHTNCYVVGGRELVVIDPASPYPEERAALDHALDALAAQGRRVVEIWLTHHHVDHVSGAAHLGARLGVPIAAHERTAALVAPAIQVDRLLADGDTRELAGDPVRRLRALFTPGHAPGHHCFVEETSGMVIAGDMVAAIGTIVIDPDEGDMRAYLDSLARLAALAPRALLPAHGMPILEAAGKLAEYRHHRLWREARVLEALVARGRARACDLVPPVYADVPAHLFGLAERSLLAHLLKLAADGRVARAGDEWVVAAAPPR